MPKAAAPRAVRGAADAALAAEMPCALPLGPLAFQLLDLTIDLVDRRAQRGLRVASRRLAVEEVLAARVQRHLRTEARLLAW